MNQELRHNQPDDHDADQCDHGHERAQEPTHQHGRDHQIGGHIHAPSNFGKAFVIGIALNAGFVTAEVIAGISGHSVALLADAGHNLSDVLGLLVAWVATLLEAWFAPASINGKRFTYYSSIKVKPPALPNTSSTEE